MAEKSPALPLSLQTDNLRIAGIEDVILPVALYDSMPLTASAARTVLEGRSAIQAVLHGEDDRLLLITGPCSIHDPQAALEYAGCLLALSEKVAEDLIVIMRVYFEKPRTTVGWKGLINDPYLDQSYRIDEGLRIARQLLVEINRLGMPAGSEFGAGITGELGWSFQVFDVEGKFLDMFTTGVRSLPYAHLITTDQMLWVADGGTMRVLKYDLNGRFLYGWGGLGGQPGQLNGPHSLTVDQDGNFYLAEVFGGRVQKFRPKPGADKAKLVGQELRALPEVR